ncbi:MAG TPA: DHA2 family efflux MFS transporter permease subunit [Mycobacteriales bacterium]|jgi:EmrB/QacA subfamily drug resistance transporter|nr:DHA2 family efflux MFS transporter permease subunit [Mycobacteriales bacterium]
MRERQTVVAAVVYVSSVFVISADMTIVHVALPTIGLELGRPPVALAAVSTAYTLSMAVFMPASGWLGDRLGSRTLILGATAVFTLASVLCGIAQTLPQLLAARVLQGAVGGLMAPVGLALLYRLVAVEGRIRLAAVLSIPSALGPAVGPVLGGVLTEQLSWRWAFFINVPVGVAVVVFGMLYMDAHRQPGEHRLDLVGLVLAGAGLSLLLLSISEIPARGVASVLVGASAAAGTALLALMVRWELRREHPAVDLRLLTDHLFRMSTVVLAVASLAYAAYLYVIAQFSQNVLQMSPTAAGLLMLPLALGYVLGAQLASRLVFPRVGPRATMQIGHVGLALALLAMLFVDRDTGLLALCGLLLLAGTFTPVIFMASQTAAFGAIPDASMGRASMLYSSQRQVFSALGVAAAATALTALGPATLTGGAPVTAPGPYHAVFVGCAAVSLAGAVFLCWMDDTTFPWRTPAAGTRHPEDDVQDSAA